VFGATSLSVPPLTGPPEWLRWLGGRRWPLRCRPCGSWSPRGPAGAASFGASTSDVRLSRATGVSALRKPAWVAKGVFLW
jgi:hypothetical protein